MAGKYSSNLEIIKRSEQKIEAIDSKISEDRTRLNVECGLSPDEASINNFTVDYEQIKKIKVKYNTFEKATYDEYLIASLVLRTIGVQLNYWEAKEFLEAAENRSIYFEEEKHPYDFSDEEIIESYRQYHM